MISQFFSGITLVVLTLLYSLVAWGAYEAEIKRGWTQVVITTLAAWTIISLGLGAFVLLWASFTGVVLSLFNTMVGG
jgi:hypothetical protein